MRIDDREVNGRITIDREETIETWFILVTLSGGVWFSGIDEQEEPILIPDSVAGASIFTSISAVKPVFLTIMTNFDGIKMLPMPAVSLDSKGTKLSIDIGELITGMTLEIALPSGTITVKPSQ